MNKNFYILNESDDKKMLFATIRLKKIVKIVKDSSIFITFAVNNEQKLR